MPNKNYAKFLALTITNFFAVNIIYHLFKLKILRFVKQKVN
jgi:hypothetical protein